MFVIGADGVGGSSWRGVAEVIIVAEQGNLFSYRSP